MHDHPGTSRDTPEERGDHGRALVSVKEAAARLQVSRVRVLQRLDDAADRLSGPPSRGRGHPRYVYVDTLGEMGTPDELVARLARAEARLAETTTALHHVNFAAEQLRDALASQAEAFELMEQSQRAQRRAFEQMRAAEAARQEAMAPLIVEDFTD